MSTTSSVRRLAPVGDPAAVGRGEVRVHGRSLRYLEAGGEGPVVLFLHGLGGSSETWRPVLRLLGGTARVVALDLLGHGGSDAPGNADYSPAGHAALVRDVLRALGVDRVTVVGHSFGGGVAMQFAYQFPERVERLVLVASGGLGPEVAFALRLVSLPGSAAVVRMLATTTPTPLGALALRAAVKLGVADQPEIDALAHGLRTLVDPAVRAAFLRTARFALGLAGQRLDARDHLHVLDAQRMLLVAGRADRTIPVAHSEAAHRMLPGSRLAVLDTSHFPHREQPEIFTSLLRDFLATTAAAPDADLHELA